ncbi:helix-turn-helix transcriptional regulator [Proteus sp. fly-1013]|uniref:helix-turn-helix domain-containing protein n=1 Tax=Proteus sp. fly-1013 TaxID=3136673 RepID=UPI0032DB376C
MTVENAKIKPIPFDMVKEQAFSNPDVEQAYKLLKQEEELQELLTEMRVKAGLNSSQVAEKMGVSQPSISRLEKNVAKASFHTLERYAKACGTTLRIQADWASIKP